MIENPGCYCAKPLVGGHIELQRFPRTQSRSNSSSLCVFMVPRYLDQ